VVSRRKVLVGGGAAAVLAALGGGVAAEMGQPTRRSASGRASSVVLCLTGLGDDVDMATSGIGFPGFATAAKLNLAFAVPGGGGNLYWHPRADGRDPLAWAVHEFLPMVEDRFRVGGSNETRATLGWSMGGYGALLAAQQRPDLFRAAAALSPAVFPSYDAARSIESGCHDRAFWRRRATTSLRFLADRLS
jgi:S-formylglutathione hydrolase FrmB